MIAKKNYRRNTNSKAETSTRAKTVQVEEVPKAAQNKGSQFNVLENEDDAEVEEMVPETLEENFPAENYKEGFPAVVDEGTK